MELLSVYHFKSKSSIGKDDFMNLCPSLIVHLDKEECRGSQPAGPSHDGEAEPQPRSLGSIPLSGNGNFTLYILKKVSSKLLNSGHLVKVNQASFIWEVLFNI